MAIEIKQPEIISKQIIIIRHHECEAEFDMDIKKQMYNEKQKLAQARSYNNRNQFARFCR